VQNSLGKKAFRRARMVAMLQYRARKQQKK
jgi:hypothetical protein